MSTISTTMGVNSFVYILTPKMVDRIHVHVSALGIVQGVNKEDEEAMLKLGEATRT